MRPPRTSHSSLSDLHPMSIFNFLKPHTFANTDPVGTRFTIAVACFRVLMATFRRPDDPTIAPFHVYATPLPPSPMPKPPPFPSPFLPPFSSSSQIRRGLYAHVFVVEHGRSLLPPHLPLFCEGPFAHRNTCVYNPREISFLALSFSRISPLSWREEDDSPSPRKTNLCEGRMTLPLP